MLETKGIRPMPSVQVVIAALNEEEGIGPTIAEINAQLGTPRVLVVDGRSSDKTVQIAKNLGADIVFENSLGKGKALAKAIEHLDFAFDYVVFTDADYTYPAEHVLEMVQILETNPGVGMVCGNRFSGHVSRRAMADAFYIGNRVIAFTHNFLNGIPLKDPLTGLRVVRTHILENWEVKSKGFDVEVELNHWVERQGFGIMEIPIVYRERLGKKKLGVRHGAQILRRIMLETTY